MLTNIRQETGSIFLYFHKQVNYMLYTDGNSKKMYEDRIGGRNLYIVLRPIQLE